MLSLLGDSIVSAHRARAKLRIALLLPFALLACDHPEKGPVPVPAQKEATRESSPKRAPAQAPRSVANPADSGAVLSDLGIFSDLDPKVHARCPSWLSQGPSVRIQFPGSERTWLSHDGIIVCEADANSKTTATSLLLTQRSQDRDGDGIFDAVDLLRGAKKEVLNGAHYQNNYHALSYPGGDVPRDEGVCTDTIVRALRNMGLDLQKEIQEDITRRPGAYPMVKKPDPNIDHRRVRTLLPYFSAFAQKLPQAHEDSASPYFPGDILFMNTMGDGQPEHMGIVSDELGASGHPLVINNWNVGTVPAAMDLLGRVPVTHRFRLVGDLVVPKEHAGLEGILKRQSLTLPAQTRQVLLVTVPFWNSSGGLLTRFARRDAQGWDRVGDPFPVRIGSTGLGCGLGVGTGLSCPVGKQEGDKRAPAGLFSLGTAFGRAASAPPGVTFPYRQATSYDYFVDAPASPRYNTWVHLNEGEKMAESAEKLLMYKWGLVINHNTSPPQQGAGSAIFLHVWKDEQTPTVGCTALAEENLLTIFRWLDVKEGPLLLQVADHLYPG